MLFFDFVSSNLDYSFFSAATLKLVLFSKLGHFPLSAFKSDVLKVMGFWTSLLPLHHLLDTKIKTNVLKAINSIASKVTGKKIIMKTRYLELLSSKCLVIQR